MNITFKLFASLAEYLPAHAHDHAVELDVTEITTPEQIIDKFSIPHNKAHLVLLNGVFLDPEARRRTVLQEGDTLAVWPPVAGG